MDLLSPTVAALEKISEWENGDTSSAAARLKQSICTVGFQVCLRVTAQVLSICLPLSRQLQTKNLDLAGALHRAAEAEESLQHLSNEADAGFRKIFNQVSKACEDFGIDANAANTRRISRRQVHRANMPAESVEEY